SGLPSWITVTGNASGTGSGTFTVNVASNSGAARSGTISIGGVSITISQATGSVACSYTLNAASQHLPAVGGTVPVTVTASSNCMFRASGLPSWITVTGNAYGTGSGTITLNVASNSSAARSGTVSIGGAS